MSHGKSKKQNLFPNEALGWREEGSYLRVFFFLIPGRSHTGCFEVWEDMLEKGFFGGIRFDCFLFLGLTRGENGEMFSKSLL